MIDSPCVGICKLDGNHCKGCGRTREDIANWSKYTDRQREEIMKILPSPRDLAEFYGIDYTVIKGV